MNNIECAIFVMLTILLVSHECLELAYAATTTCVYCPEATPVMIQVRESSNYTVANSLSESRLSVSGIVIAITTSIVIVILITVVISGAISGAVIKLRKRRQTIQSKLVSQCHVLETSDTVSLSLTCQSQPFEFDENISCYRGSCEDSTNAASNVEQCNIANPHGCVLEYCVDPIERVTFDSKGGHYLNKQQGISLKVPPGAIREGTPGDITVEIGIFLSCSVPFPAGMRPVSPLLTMCVANNHHYQFLKPVEVNIPHCLDITNKCDEESIEIQFLKLSHGSQLFDKADGEATFNSFSGTLKTEHFCFFCIVANKQKVDLSRVNYRLLKIVPKSTASKWKIYYCVTYFFPTCLRAVEKQYCPQKYNIQSLQRFKFANLGYIAVNFERQTSEGWKLALENSEKIYAKDLEFWDIEPSELKQMELEELYPPRFMIDVSGTEAHKSGHLWIQFSGMTTEFKSELILERKEMEEFVCSNSQLICSQSSDSATSIVSNPHVGKSETPLPYSVESKDYGFDRPPSSIEHSMSASSSGYASWCSDKPNEPNHQDLMNKVAVKIPDKWMLFGIQLGLDQRQLDTIEQRRAVVDPHICFSAVFTEWKERMTSPYLWSTVIDALKSPLLGENRLAQILQQDLGVSFELSSEENSSLSETG